MQTSDSMIDHPEQNSNADSAPYQYVLLTDEQRQQIIHTARPSRQKAFSCDNLNLVYGVKSEKSGFVMVLTYYLSDAIKRCDQPDDYRFVLLFSHKAQEISCQQERGKEDLTLLSRVSSNMEEEVKGALHFYQTDHSNWDLMEKVFGEEKSYSKYSHQNKQYIKELIYDPEDAKAAQKSITTPQTSNDHNDSAQQQTSSRQTYQPNSESKSGHFQKEADTGSNRGEYSKHLPRLRKKTIAVIFGIIGVLMVTAYILLPAQETSRLVAGILCIVFCVLAYLTS